MLICKQHTYTLGVVLDTARRCTTATAKRVRGTPVAHVQTTPTACANQHSHSDRLQSGQEEFRQMKVDARKKKNRYHALESRKRQLKKVHGLMQRESELKAGNARVLGVIQELQRENTELEAGLAADFFLC